MEKNKKKYITNPLVSIVIPSYNMGEFVSDAIISCLNQTYNNIEIIIVDDGSDDDTKQIVKRFGSKVQYYKKQNGGVSSARNYGIKMAKGQYVSFIDADDIWLPKKLEMQIDAINKDPLIKATSCGYAIMNDKCKIVMGAMLRKNFNKKEDLYKNLSISQIIPGSSSGMMIENECFDKAGVFDEDLYIGEDWDMWLRIAKETNIHFVEEVLVILRGRNTKGGERTLEHERAQVERVINKSVSKKIKNKAYAALYARLGSTYLSIGQFNIAFRYLLMSFKKYLLPIFPIDIKNKYKYPKKPRHYLLVKSLFKSLHKIKAK